MSAAGVRRLGALALACAVLAAVALASRPLVPVDETRYASVAWEMWLRGDFLVPWLNGEPYSHKPPLLFWLYHAGWALFGVNDCWPRLVPALFAFGSLGLTWHIGRELWDGTQRGWDAALMLLGCLLFAAFATLAMFDMPLVFFVLLAMAALLRAPRKPVAWWGYGAALGLGVLTKGPVMLLHLLPVALLAPLWTKPLDGWGRWYARLAAAVLLGAAIALTWAVPAALHGGADYARAIFWGQSADRMVNSIAHRHPWWWYLPQLPLALFPWTVWPALWRGAGRGRALLADAGARFCLAWTVPVFVGFSLISGKQIQYLLPMTPALALLMAALLPAGHRRGAWMPCLLLVFAGLLLTMLPAVGPALGLPAWTGQVPPAPGAILLVLVLALWATGKGEGRWIPALASGSVAAVALLHVALFPAAGVAYDLRPLAARIARLQDEGVSVAHVGKYHGQYQFLGRLKRPLAVVEADALDGWLARHPGGRVVAYFDAPPSQGRLDYAQPYRGKGMVALWAPAPASPVQAGTRLSGE